MNTYEFGKFLSQLRKEKGLTQIQLAEQLNVTDKAVSRWETGKNYPDIEIFSDLSKLLDVSINELIEGKRIETDNLFNGNEQYIMSISKEEYIEINKLYTKNTKKEYFRIILIFAVACIVFVPFEITISLSFLFLAILYSVIFAIRHQSLKKGYKEKSLTVENRHQIIDISEERVSISVIENNELTDKYTVAYNDITYLDENEDYFTFADKVHLFYIKRESLKDESILYEHFSNISDKLKNNKKSRTIVSSLLITTVYLGLLAMYSTDEFAILFGNPCKWLYLLALPFGIATVLYSIVLKKKQLKYLPNLIIGIILSLSILANCLSILDFNKYYNSGYNVITETEEKIGIEMPKPDYIEFYKDSYSEDNRIEIINDVYIEFYDSDYVEYSDAAVDEMLKNEIWLDELPVKFLNVIPYADYFSDSEFVILYNIDTKTVNVAPEDKGTHHLAIIAYYYGTIDIVEYAITL
ncbi:MAG: helix-turn-helix transcriptional regulator [Clostridia bacterium]|nr:helix-turn-helix transcriptional regulator [Clostridia bacterium]